MQLWGIIAPPPNKCTCGPGGTGDSQGVGRVTVEEVRGRWVERHSRKAEEKGLEEKVASLGTNGLESRIVSCKHT